MNYKGLKVLLLDGFGRQIPTLLKQLHDLGCVVTVVCDSKLDVGYTSRYPSKKVIIKGVREDVGDLKDYIECELRKNSFDVIFPVLEKTTDLTLSLQEAGKLGDVKVICAPRHAFDQAYDKEKTMQVCMENNIPCPLTRLDTEPIDEYLSKVTFPLACKPRKGSGAAGFKIVKTEEQLRKYIEDKIIIPDQYVIQEFIPHTDYHYGVYLMFDNNHQPIYSLVVKSCRQYPVNGGPGCYIRTVKNEMIQKDAEELFRKLEWSGFGHVGLIMDPRDGRAKVMEINGRIPAGVKICNCMGIPTVKILLDWVFGKELLPYKYELKENYGLRHSQADFMWLMHAKNRLSAKPNWFNFMKASDYVFYWRDPIPYFSYSIEHVLTYKNDMKKRS